MDFAFLLRDARERRRWTIEELADRTGISARSIAGYERGERIPPLDKAASLLEAVGIALTIGRSVEQLQTAGADTTGEVSRIRITAAGGIIGRFEIRYRSTGEEPVLDLGIEPYANLERDSAIADANSDLTK